MTRTKALILLVATGFFVWASTSYFTGIGTDADFKMPAVVCLLLLGAAVWLDYRAQEQRTRRHVIAATWMRRERSQ